MKAHQLHDLIERGETSFISAVQTVPAFTLVWFYFLFSREVSCVLFAVWASHHTRRLIQPGDTFSFVDCVCRGEARRGRSSRDFLRSL